MDVATGKRVVTVEEAVTEDSAEVDNTQVINSTNKREHPTTNNLRFTNGVVAADKEAVEVATVMYTALSDDVIRLVRTAITFYVLFVDHFGT